MRYLAIGITAAEIWHSSDLRFMPERREIRSNELSDICQTSYKKMSLGYSEELALENCSKPLHLLVPDKRAIHHCVDTVGHVWGSPDQLPDGSAVELGKSVLVASPELTLATLARDETPVVEFALFASELCGRYASPSFDAASLRRCEPATSISQIERFADRLAGWRGIAALCSSNPWIVENSASPRETQLALLLGMPSRFGGFGLPRPVMNHVIQLSSEARLLTTLDRYEVDLCWPKQKVAVEYNSDEFHQRDKKSDAVKANALRAMGYEVIVVTWDQLRSFSEMNRVALAVRKALGIRRRPISLKLEGRREDLHWALVNKPHLFDKDYDPSSDRYTWW